MAGTSYQDAGSGRIAAGIGLGIAALAVMVGIDINVRLAGEAGYSTGQTIFFRALTGLVTLSPFLWKVGRKRLFAIQQRKLHVVRVFLVLSMTAMFYYALPRMPLAELTILTFVSPIFVTLLSPWLLGDQIGWHRRLAVLAGFGGVLVVYNPGADLFQPISLVVLLASLFFALNMIVVQKLMRTETSESLILFMTLGLLVLSAPFAILDWQWPDAYGWTILFMLGICGTVAHLFHNVAVDMAGASRLAPFDYSTIIWATLAGWFFWQEVPDMTAILGAVVIILSGLYIFWRETVHNQKKFAADATAPEI